MPVELLVRIVISGMTGETGSKRDVDVLDEHAFYCSLLPLSKAYYAEANNERSWYQLARYRCDRYVGRHAFQPAEGGHFEIKYVVANGGELMISQEQSESYRRSKAKNGAKSSNETTEKPESARQKAEARRRSEFLSERSYRDFCFALDAGVRLERLLDADEFLGNEGFIFRALGYGQWCTMACFGVPLNKGRNVADEEKEVSLNNAFLEAAPHVANIFEDSVGSEEGAETKDDRVEFTDGKQGTAFIDCLANSDESEVSGEEGSNDEGSDGDSGENENKKARSAKVSTRVQQLRALSQKLAAFPLPLVFASGNHSNCDTLCDALYVTYGSALGGVLIYKSW